jgi:hypothetical protein
MTYYHIYLKSMKICHLSGRFIVCLFLALGELVGLSLAGPLSEAERVEEYDKRYTRVWPPKEYVPNTPGWKSLMEKRFRQVKEIDDGGEKYEGFMQVGMDGMLDGQFFFRHSSYHSS